MTIKYTIQISIIALKHRINRLENKTNGYHDYIDAIEYAKRHEDPFAETNMLDLASLLQQSYQKNNTNKFTPNLEFFIDLITSCLLINAQIIKD